MTVLELLITMTVVLVVTGLTALLLQSTSRAALRTTMRTEMQQQALVAIQRLVTDLRRSCCAGVSIRSGAAPVALAICPLSQPDLRAGSQTGVLNNGELLWSDFYQIYWYDASAQKLIYREWPPGAHGRGAGRDQTAPSDSGSNRGDFECAAGPAFDFDDRSDRL